MKIRKVIRLDPKDFSPGSFIGFETPFAGTYAEMMRREFSPEALAPLIEKLPPESRARLERQFPSIKHPPAIQ
jgi:hypothetical protein